MDLGCPGPESKDFREETLRKSLRTIVFEWVLVVPDQEAMISLKNPEGNP